MGSLKLTVLVAVLAFAFGQSVMAAPIPIENPSFEQPVTSSEYWYPDSIGEMPGWGYWDRYGIGTNTRCVINAANANRLPSGAPDGLQVGAAREGFFRQILYGQTVQANKTYTLSASLGIDTWFPTQGLIPRGTKFGLWAVTWDPSYAETELVSQTFPQGAWTYGTMSPVSTSVNIPNITPYAGWTLIVGIDQTTPNSIVEIDNVKLDSITTNDWVGNQIGVTDDNWVPQPWTALQLGSSNPVRVSCWGRDYTFNASGLASVQSQGAELLTSSMVWDVHVWKSVSDPNHHVNWTPESTSITRQASGAVEFTSSQLGDESGLRLICNGRIEFDGFVKLAFRLESPNTVTVKRVAVDVPFNSAHATLMHYFPKVPVWYGGVGIDGINAGSVPAAGWSSVFLPHVWLGDEDRGLQWLCESDAGWKPADPATAIQVLPNGGTTTLRLNLIGTSTTLTSSSPRQYTFAFEASPVKPMPADRYTWHYTHVGGCSDVLSKADLLHDYGVNGVSTHTWTEWLGYPMTSIPRNIPVLQWATTAAHDRNMDMMVLQTFLMSDATPEYPAFNEECRIVDDYAYWCPGYVNDTVYAVCQNSVWSDFMIKGIDTTLRDFNLDGVYSDSMTCIGDCVNRLHGCGYVGDDGQVYPTVEIFAMRDFTKRLYRILEQQGTARGKRLKFVGHTSANIMLPALGFCDRYLDTEHLVNMTRPFRIPLDVFRAEYMGRNFGIPAQTLSYYSSTGKGLTVQEMLAISLLHDTELPWNYDFMSPIWKAWDSFGMSNVQFLPYWKAWGWQAPSGVQVSAYSKPSGSEMLVVAANLSEVQTQGTLGFNRPVISAKDIFTSNAVVVQNGMIAETFPVWQTRMYHVQLVADSSIGDVRKSVDGTAVACNGVVTAALDGFFYIESPDRISGIRVSKANHGLSVGQTVAVSGYVYTLSSGEKYIAAGSATASGSGTIAPLAITNKALGGGSNGVGQPGVLGGTGLNNIGLLVKTTGKILSVQPTWFKIDDGSGVDVKVLGAAPVGAEYVTVTGISSCEESGGVLAREIIATNVSEISVSRQK
ncbi:MAG: glycoside hydrolase domain-containing protein [Armatimonadota bacterium]